MAVETSILIEARLLVEVATRNYNVIGAQVRGLTHEDSLLQLPFRGNCLNWVVGHITQSRNKMLMLVDEPTVWTAEQIARYDRESPPVTSSDDAIHFEQILADLQTAHERLISRLERITHDELLAPAKPVIQRAPPWTTGEFLHFLLWHETYHIGNTEILRQLSGTNDQVI